mmetsp:Transcript_15960/g.32711  ORF Transcript_15960/g.32711 Transcript_15960/m.32711 type:complete len:306 (+) Transcript_15960:603-1520(+)
MNLLVDEPRVGDFVVVKVAKVTNDLLGGLDVLGAVAGNFDANRGSDVADLHRFGGPVRLGDRELDIELGLDRLDDLSAGTNDFRQEPGMHRHGGLAKALGLQEGSVSTIGELENRLLGQEPGFGASLRNHDGCLGGCRRRGWFGFVGLRGVNVELRSGLFLDFVHGRSLGTDDDSDPGSGDDNTHGNLFRGGGRRRGRLCLLLLRGKTLLFLFGSLGDRFPDLFFDVSSWLQRGRHDGRSGCRCRLLLWWFRCRCVCACACLRFVGFFVGIGFGVRTVRRLGVVFGFLFLLLASVRSDGSGGGCR